MEPNASSSSSATSPSNSNSNIGNLPSSKRTTNTTGSGNCCAECGLKINGQFVRALNGHYHLACFRCVDCKQIVAEKFFPLKDVHGALQVFCEKDYFRRLDLLCAKCGCALRGPHINALGKKYHLDHFTCSVCPTVFKQHDQYFERNKDVYCEYHYSVMFASKCGGCSTAVLKNFVEMKKEGVDEQWHPECYMIYKLWNVKMTPKDNTNPLSPTSNYIIATTSTSSTDSTEEIIKQRLKLDRVHRILNTLSLFEESSAECIQEMLVHFSNQSYQEGVMQADKFIGHIEALYCGLDSVEARLVAVGDSTGMSPVKEPKQLAKKIVNFFSLLCYGRDPSLRQEATKKLIALVTSLARQLKALIRATLSGSLKLEQSYNQPTAVDDFLNILLSLGDPRDISEIRRLYNTNSISSSDDTTTNNNNTEYCMGCSKTVEDANYRLDLAHWHSSCFLCGVCGVGLAASTARMDFGKAAGHVLPSHVSSSSADELTISSPSSSSSLPGGVAGAGDIVKALLFCPQHAPPTSKAGFEPVSQLRQYVYLLRCALKRLCVQLKITLDENVTSDHSHISDKIRKSTDLLSGSMRGEGGSGGGGISQSAAAASTSSSTSAGNDDTTGSINDSRPVTVSGAGPIIHATSPLHDAPATSFSESVNSMRSVKDALPSSSSYSTAATSHYQQHQISSSTPPNNTPSLVGYSHPSSYPVSLNKSLNIPQPSSLSSSSLGNSPRSGFEFISPSSSRQPSTTTSPRTALGSSMGSGGAGSATLGHPFHHHPTPHNIHHQQQGGTLPQKQMLLSELGPLELLGVRQLAALKLYPIMDGYFTYEELTEMSETRKQRSVWTKMVDVLKPTKKNTKVEGTFGVPLEVLVEKYGIETDLGPATNGSVRIPLVVDACIRSMLQGDMSVEGIFRKNGNIKRLKTVSETLDRDPRCVDFSGDNSIQIAALLKKFLREMPEPLLTFRLHKLFLASQKLADENLRKEALHYVCCLLPKPNIDLLVVLLWFLREVSYHSAPTSQTSSVGDSTSLIHQVVIQQQQQHAAVAGVGGAGEEGDDVVDSATATGTGGGNKMDIDNLAVVIMPNILYAKSRNPVDDDTPHAIQAITMLLKYQNELWTVPDSVMNMLLDDMKGYDADIPDPTKEKEIMKKFENVMVRTRKSATSQEITHVTTSSDFAADTSSTARIEDHHVE